MVGGWWQYTFTTPKVITGYSLTAGATAKANMPKDWSLLGSNDETNWYTLHADTGITYDNSETKSFTLSTIGVYKYYRLNVTSTNVSGGIELMIGNISFVFGVAPEPHQGFRLVKSDSSMLTNQTEWIVPKIDGNAMINLNSSTGVIEVNIKDVIGRDAYTVDASDKIMLAVVEHATNDITQIKAYDASQHKWVTQVAKSGDYIIHKNGDQNLSIASPVAILTNGETTISSGEAAPAGSNNYASWVNMFDDDPTSHFYVHKQSTDDASSMVGRWWGVKWDTTQTISGINFSHGLGNRCYLDSFKLLGRNADGDDWTDLSGVIDSAPAPDSGKVTFSYTLPNAASYKQFAIQYVSGDGYGIDWGIYLQIQHVEFVSTGISGGGVASSINDALELASANSPVISQNDTILYNNISANVFFGTPNAPSISNKIGWAVGLHSISGSHEAPSIWNIRMLMNGLNKRISKTGLDYFIYTGSNQIDINNNTGSDITGLKAFIL
jgi:hypothetical protein